jgi:hypothetical protein
MQTPDRQPAGMTSHRTPQGKVQDGWSGVFFCLERTAHGGLLGA